MRRHHNMSQNISDKPKVKKAKEFLVKKFLDDVWDGGDLENPCHWIRNECFLELQSWWSNQSWIWTRLGPSREMFWFDQNIYRLDCNFGPFWDCKCDVSSWAMVMKSVLRHVIWYRTYVDAIYGPSSNFSTFYISKSLIMVQDVVRGN